ncbi:MAG: hypothetical protein IJZ51_09385 [Ruminiclostridium sp.]|nr:hypothetical protein [Ruminiclostridium sp.]
MRRRKRKANLKGDMVILLALFHRYGWIIAMLLCITFLPVNKFYTAGAFLLIYSIWSFVGYKCRWKHIYCSYQNAYRKQNAYHKKMTPDSINWNQIKKRDAYIVPLIFLIFGLMILGVAVFL